MNYMKNQDQQEERLILNKLKQNSELISSSVQHSGELPTVCPLE